MFQVLLFSFSYFSWLNLCSMNTLSFNMCASQTLKSETWETLQNENITLAQLFGWPRDQASAGYNGGKVFRIERFALEVPPKSATLSWAHNSYNQQASITSTRRRNSKHDQVGASSFCHLSWQQTSNTHLTADSKQQTTDSEIRKEIGAKTRQKSLAALMVGC